MPTYLYEFNVLSNYLISICFYQSKCNFVKSPRKMKRCAKQTTFFFFLNLINYKVLIVKKKPTKHCIIFWTTQLHWFVECYFFFINLISLKSNFAALPSLYQLDVFVLPSTTIPHCSITNRFYAYLGGLYFIIYPPILCSCGNPPCPCTRILARAQYQTTKDGSSCFIPPSRVYYNCYCCCC